MHIYRGNKGSLFILKKVDTALDADGAWAAELTKTRKKITTDKILPSKMKSPPIPLKNTSPSFLSPTFFSLFGKKSVPKVPKRVCVILPAQLASKEDYTELCSSITTSTGFETTVAPLAFKDWVVCG
jgi:hypothetical protein